MEILLGSIRELDLNEWVSIGMFIAGVAVVYLLPNILPIEAKIYSFLFGPFAAMLFDQTIGVPPFDLYDVGDGPHFPLSDMMSYAMYIPFGYIFLHLYQLIGIKGYRSIFYVLFWSFVGVAVEWFSMKVEIFHYKNGYKIIYSFPIYIFVQSVFLMIYHYGFKKSLNEKQTPFLR